MPRKVAIPVLAVAALAVVYVVLRGRQAAGVQRAPAQPEQSPGGGGSGGGYVTAQPAPNPTGDLLERLGYEREKFRLDVEGHKETERQAGAQLGYREQKSTLDAFLQLLPYQLQTQQEAQRTGQAGERLQQARLGTAQAGERLQVARFGTAQAGEELVARSVKKKKKVECPKGQHLVVLADGSAQCQDKGGHGFNFATITQGIGEFATGVWRGAASAAPGIGAAAAEYGAAQAGIVPGRTSGRPGVSTPGINPRPSDATPGWTPHGPEGNPYAQYGMEDAR